MQIATLLIITAAQGCTQNWHQLVRALMLQKEKQMQRLPELDVLWTYAVTSVKTEQVLDVGRVEFLVSHEVLQTASVMHNVQHAKWADQLPRRTFWRDLQLPLSPWRNAPWRHLRLHGQYERTGAQYPPGHARAMRWQRKTSARVWFLPGNFGTGLSNNNNLMQPPSGKRTQGGGRCNPYSPPTSHARVALHLRPLPCAGI